MMYELGYDVKQLARTRIGSLRLDVHRGEWRLLTPKEVQNLQIEEKRAPTKPKSGPPKHAKPRTASRGKPDGKRPEGKPSSAKGRPGRKPAGGTRGRARA
jgi:hypothetical protein